jgi:hypothetical protein
MHLVKDCENKPPLDPVLVVSTPRARVWIELPHETTETVQKVERITGKSGKIYYARAIRMLLKSFDL